MKKYWKLFIPYYGMYYGSKIDMENVGISHPIIYFGSATAQAFYIAILFAILVL